MMNTRKKALREMITKLYSTKNTVEQLKVLMTKVSIMAKVQLGT